MSGKTRAYAARVDIRATVERVWAAMSTTAALQRWMSPEARMATQAGGLCSGSLDRQRRFTARIDVLDPPRRIRLVHLPPEDLPALAAVVVDDLVIEPRAPDIIVRVLGSGFPREDEFAEFYMRRQIGWRRALARLKVYLEKQMDLETPANRKGNP